MATTRQIVKNLGDVREQLERDIAAGQRAFDLRTGILSVAVPATLLDTIVQSLTHTLDHLKRSTR